MTLLDKNGIKADAFTRVSLADIAGVNAPLVSLADLEGALGLAGKATIGVDLPNTAKSDAVVPHFGALSLITVAFPAFSDGRGFSLARRLRRLGYKGTLRAVGPLIADQFAYALACGFDEIELPEASASRQPFEQWQKAGASITLGYQRGMAREGSILDQRRAARAEGRND